MTGTRPRVKRLQTPQTTNRRECDRHPKMTGLLTTSLRVVDSAASKLQATRVMRMVKPHRLVTPIDHGTPKEAVRFKSMTLKEAYSVPKHTSAICVQSFDDSLNSAIHITYRISLRSSSLREPRYPLLRVLDRFDFASPRDDTSPAEHVLTQSAQNRKVWLLMRCGSLVATRTV